MYSLPAARMTRFITFILLTTFLLAARTTGEETSWFQKQSKWNDHEQYHFKAAGRDAYLVTPKQPSAGNPWIWRARFPGYHAEMDVQLLKRGYHIGYVDVAGLYGSPKAIEIGNAFYELMTKERKLATRPALEGVSRGGLFVYNWAAANPDKVACIYCDTPVCDIKSWPGGKGSGVGAAANWQECLKVFGIDESAYETFQQNPIDHAAVIAEADIPLLHIVSENDRVVPPAENTYVLRDRLKELGHNLEVIKVVEGTDKSQGHHFAHPAIDRVVEFIDAQTARIGLLTAARKVIFLGDSITYAGGYVSRFESWLVSQNSPTAPQIMNLGLSSETVSGLSEDGHARGKFPRPDLAERLDRVLDLTKPDLVIACYGINCGIYQPFDEERFAAYQKGIERLKAKVEEAGGNIIFMTPPTFDDQRSNKKFSYNAVLDRYSEWLVKQQSERGWRIIPLHSAMNSKLAEMRKQDPSFEFQRDGVHPNAAGHEFIAGELIKWFGGDSTAAANPKLAKLVNQRMQILRDSYLTAARHLRPGVREGLPVEEALIKSQELSAQIDKLNKPNASDEIAESLSKYLEKPVAERKTIGELPFAKQPITREQAERSLDLLWNDYADRIRKERSEEVKAKSITIGDHTLKYDYREFGEAPAGGRSLFISMHGGGGGSKRMNDGQWRNQIRLYKPAEGIYLAPRAPTNTWNLWHQGHIDPLFDRLITNMIVFENVNPNRVYLMGYSAGGDGVYQLAPRMADRFAAAAMMAGHPNETSALGLRNLPFALFMGGKDGAYNRNKVAAKWKSRLAELHDSDKEGYTHLVTIYPEKRHWMDGEDASGVPWMAKFNRRQYPKKVVWKQDDVTHKRFYWLAVDQPKERTELIATINGQKITVQTELKTFAIRLNDEMLDLDKEVEVWVGDKTVVKEKPKRTIATIATTLDERNDPSMWFSAEIKVTVPEGP